MKKIYIFAGMICLILVACNGLFQSDSVKDFIPGTYSGAYTTEFNQSRDTLLIEPLVKHGSETYAITRRTYVSFNHNERKRNPEYKIIHWTGSYDPGAKTVVVNNNGRILSFDPVNKEMKMGNTSYKKL